MSDPTQSAPDGSSVQVQASDHSVAAHTVQGNVLAGTGNQVVTGHVVITHPGVLLPGPQDVELARPLVGLPRPPSRVFVGRDKLLAQLHASAAGATAVVTQTIAGLGGIGKTELVLHYCHTHRDQFSILWWITADRPDSVEAGLAGLTTAVAGTVNRTGPAKVGEAATWAQGLLTANPGWLLVFDNVEDQADVEGWLARLSGGRVLVTSRRDTDWENRAETLIRLDVLDTDAAVAVLTSGQNQPDLVTARELAAELGLLPLALTQAAAYMACTRIIVSDYLARLRARPAKTLATAAPGTSGVQQTVARVWDLTLAAIGTADPFAIDVLRVLSCLAPDNVPRRLLAGLGDEPETVDVALGLLASYSMITLTERAVSVHRLVQAVVIAQAAQVGVAGDSLWQALDLLDRACPMDDPRRTTQDWPWWAVLVPHMQAVADRWPTNTPDSRLNQLLRQASLYLFTQGATATKVALNERTLAICEETLGSDHPDTLTSRHNLAVGYWSAGRYAEAISMHEQTLADRTRILGRDHPDTLTSRHNLAVSYGSAGRYAEAIPLEEQTLADRTRILGPDHPDTLTSRHSLAAGYGSAGRYAEAIPLEEQTLADRTRILGPDHPDTLRSRQGLATNYWSVGRYAEAIPLEEQTLADRTRILGPDHPDTLDSRHNLAISYRSMGRYAEAIPLHEQTLADRIRILGPDHPDTLTSRSHLAAGYWSAGRYAEAISLHEQTLADRIRILGPDHPDTLTSRDSLATIKRQHKGSEPDNTD